MAPGANAELKEFELPPSDAVLGQLEIPDEAVAVRGSIGRVSSA